MTQVKPRKGWRMSCDVVEVTERLENEQSSFPNLSVTYSTKAMCGSPGELSEEYVT